MKTAKSANGKNSEGASIVRGVTITHFLLMFGYKLFSAYFPLYLAARHFSLPQIGWTYLLIYLPIAFFAPLSGFICRRINPVLLMASGVMGYGVYALLMILGVYGTMFFLSQIMLGISASFFFTSSRILLMSYPLVNARRAFSWFYNAPFWADAVAPVIGGFLIWYGGFGAAFTFSIIIILAAAASAFSLWGVASRRGIRVISLEVWAQKWRHLLSKAGSAEMFPSLGISFAVLWANGIFAAFFVLFLKNALSWSQNAVIVYTAASSAFFSIAYIVFIRPRQKGVDGKNILIGGAVSGVFTLMLVAPLAFLGYAAIFVLEFFKNAGGFICNAGRSALVAGKMEKDPEEAGAFDTIFSPLGVALGSLTGTLLVGVLGYQGLFFVAAAVLLSVVFIVLSLQKNKNF